MDLAAAYGLGLRDIVHDAHEILRSRGATEPRLPIPAERPAPSPAELAAARTSAAAELSLAGAGIRVTEGRAALEACERLLATHGVPHPGDAEGPRVSGALPHPGDLDAAKLGAGAKALTTPVCEAYRSAWEAYRSACADHHARAALVLLDDLLARYDARVRTAEGRAGGRGLRGPRARRARPPGLTRTSGGAGASGSR